MRVSTPQFYFQSALQLTNKQSSLNEQFEHLSSQKRVLTAKDDAVAFGTLNGYKEELRNIDKYQRNITQAENRNSLQDTLFDNAEDFLLQVKQTFIQANNGTLSNNDLTSLGELVTNAQAEILNIANSKDETGGYLFAGFQTDKKPFNLLADGSVTYAGDSGVRELQIASSISVELNQPGDEAFEKIANPQGDFVTNYNTNTSGISVEKAVITTPSAFNSSGFPPEYNFQFTSATDLTVTDSNGVTVFNTNSYAAGQTVSFLGIDVEISGNPLPGDNFELSLQENISVFDTLKSAIDWIAEGDSPANQIQHNVDYDHILKQIDSALNHFTARRAEAGIRSQLIENQENSHLDKELVLSKATSSIEDLDFAKAVSTFEQSQVALQAAQQTFVQIKDLNLFNFI